MQKGKIIEISASLDSSNKSSETTRLFESIVKTAYENRKALKRGVIDCDVNSKNFAIITLNLNKISKRKQRRYNLHRLFDGTFQLQRCSFCGCLYLTYFSYTYREYSGCVGRSYECITCRSLRNKEAHEVLEIRKKKGVKAAKKFQLDLIGGTNTMYDKNQRQSYSEITVGQLIEQLKSLPQDAQIFICGDDYCYIHVESDGSVVNLDNEALEECYDDDINSEA